MSEELNMTLVKSLAGAAAHWWAEQLNGSVKHDNGDHEMHSVLAGLMADMLSKPVDKDQLQKFEEVLSEKIEADILKQSKSFSRIYPVYLRCDYDPCTMLYEASKEAGVFTANFPWKISMNIDYNKGTVIVSAGYREPWVQIFPKGEKKEEVKKEEKREEVKKEEYTPRWGGLRKL